LEQQDERLEEGLEVVDVVEAAADLDVLEEGHAEDGKNEHDKEEKEADVEEGGHGHHQREEEGSNPLGALDETKDSPHLRHAHHSQQGRRHKILLDKVTEKNNFVLGPALFKGFGYIRSRLFAKSRSKFIKAEKKLRWNYSTLFYLDHHKGL
jgi:hypothetical protein